MPYAGIHKTHARTQQRTHARTQASTHAPNDNNGLPHKTLRERTCLVVIYSWIGLASSTDFSDIGRKPSQDILVCFKTYTLYISIAVVRGLLLIVGG